MTEFHISDGRDPDDVRLKIDRRYVFVPRRDLFALADLLCDFISDGRNQAVTA